MATTEVFLSSNKQYTDEFHFEAVKQVIERARRTRSWTPFAKMAQSRFRAPCVPVTCPSPQGLDPLIPQR